MSSLRMTVLDQKHALLSQKIAAREAEIKAYQGVVDFMYNELGRIEAEMDSLREVEKYGSSSIE